jgi:hypothetical protein
MCKEYKSVHSRDVKAEKTEPKAEEWIHVDADQTMTLTVSRS